MDNLSTQGGASPQAQRRVTYSVVVPACNEQAVLAETLERTVTSLEKLGASWEILAVDDGSRDASWEVIEAASRKEPRIRGLGLSRNFGHQVAVYAGLSNAEGEAVAVMDADGQDPPELLPELFEQWKAGHDVVYAVRKRRRASLLRRAGYAIFYRLLRSIVSFDIPLDSGDFSVMDRKVVDFIVKHAGHNPFIRGLRSWYGGRQTGIEYDRPGRSDGESKYSLADLFVLALSGISSFSKAPLRLAMLVGALLAAGGFGFGVYAIVAKYAFGVSPVGYTSVISMVAILGGVQLLFLGIVAEYLGNVFDEVKGRPPYLVSRQTLSG